MVLVVVNRNLVVDKYGKEMHGRYTFYPLQTLHIMHISTLFKEDRMHNKCLVCKGYFFLHKCLDIMEV